MQLKYSAASHNGSRPSNQDNFRAGAGVPWANLSTNFACKGSLDSRQLQVFCVCDGVGGAAMGDRASQNALEAIARFLNIHAEDPEEQQLSLEDIAMQAAQAAQDQVLHFYEHMDLAGGCTLVMALIQDDRYVLLNIGDSPAFLYRRAADSVEELSQRHNLAGEKLRSGETPEPDDYCQLLRYLGKYGYSAADMAFITEGTLEPGDRLLICSDGVSEAFTPDALRLSMKRRRSAQVMTNRAAKKEYADNCTAVCIQVKRKGIF